MKKRITNEDIEKIVRNLIEELYTPPKTEYLCEGIKVERTRDKKLVSFDPTNEDGVDTSIDNNPTVNTTVLEGIPIWSVFQRNKRGREDWFRKIDGNPLIYALKNENNYVFKTQKDKEEIVNRIIEILKKFEQEHKSNTVILVPSTNFLNKFIVSLYHEVNPNVTVIDDVLVKMTTEEVYEEVDKHGSYFNEYFKEDIDIAFRRLNYYLNLMDDKNNGIFSYHLISDNDIREAIRTTIRLSDNAYYRYGSDIDGKDVLIIDDTISRGATIRQANNLIAKGNTFSPRSVTLLTLFSPLN